MSERLAHRRIAFLMANSGVEQAELTEPRNALTYAGAQVTLLAPRAGTITARNNDVEPGDEFEADLAVADADVDDYDALVLPGGTTNPDVLRLDGDAVKFVRRFVSTGKIVAAICHGPWTLVEAGVLGRKTLTSWPSLRTDIENAGGMWVDQQTCVCLANGWILVTSRNPDDLSAFGQAIITAVSA